MKFLKYLFLLILIVFIGGAVYYATKDGSYEVTKSHQINAPVPVVYEVVNNYKTWEDWDAIKAKDTTAVFNFEKDSIGVDAGLSWDGETQGNLRTIKTIPNQKILQATTFNAPGGERSAQVIWTFEAKGDGTLVTRTLSGENSLFQKAYLDIFNSDFERNVQDAYALAFERLTKKVNKVMAAYSIEINGITEHSGGFYMYASAAVDFDALAVRTTALLSTVLNYLEAEDITTSGNPMTVYNEWNASQGTAIISCGYPVSTRVITPAASTVLTGYLPTQTVVKVTLKGSYDYLRNAWAKARDYAAENGYMQADKPFEVYLTDPDTTPNPADYKTELYLPVSQQLEL